MKIVAKDYGNRSNLIKGVIDLTQKNTESLQINSVGIPSLRIPTQLETVSFRLLPEGMKIDVPELPKEELEKLYWWKHVEFQIDSESASDGIKWMSHETFKKVHESWDKRDEILSEFNLTPDDILYTRSISNHGSYSISKEDLVILLGMKGRMTIRDSVQVLGLHEDVILERIAKAMKYKLLGKSAHLKKTNYPESIKAMGHRINMFYSNLKSWFGNSTFPRHDYFSKELEILSSRYPDAECLAINPDGIDVSESVLSLSFSKDPEFVSSVGSKIYHPLSLLFCNLVIGSAYAFSVESVYRVLDITDRSLIERYAKTNDESLPIFLRSFNE